jgi:glycosyltransferase involved in cell wall biosynthesis
MSVDETRSEEQAGEATPDPLFSVIIPTYERRDFLAAAVHSVLAQTVEDLECIVIDDASPSGVDLRLHDSRLRVTRHPENLGATCARNTGLALARGRYVAFLDDDDVWTPRRLEYALEGLARAPISICYRGSFDGRPSRNPTLNGYVHDEILNDLTPNLGQTACLRSLALLLDERFVACEDTEWWLRMTRVGRVSTVPKVGMLYREHDGPRNLNGAPARLSGSHQLLDMHKDYFAGHRRAYAFRWKRIGLLAQKVNDRGLARRAFLKSAVLWPEARLVVHFGRTMLKSGKAPRQGGLQQAV